LNTVGVMPAKAGIQQTLVARIPEGDGYWIARSSRAMTAP